MAPQNRIRPLHFSVTPESPFWHTHIIGAVRALLFTRRFTRGMHSMEMMWSIARATRAEVMLALWYLRERKVVGYRSFDGRWYYDRNEPWRAA